MDGIRNESVRGTSAHVFQVLTIKPQEADRETAWTCSGRDSEYVSGGMLESELAGRKSKEKIYGCGGERRHELIVTAGHQLTEEEGKNEDF